MGGWASGGLAASRLTPRGIVTGRRLACGLVVGGQLGRVDFGGAVGGDGPGHAGGVGSALAAKSIQESTGSGRAVFVGSVPAIEKSSDDQLVERDAGHLMQDGADLGRAEGGVVGMPVEQRDKSGGNGGDVTEFVGDVDIDGGTL